MRGSTRRQVINSLILLRCRHRRRRCSLRQELGYLAGRRLLYAGCSPLPGGSSVDVTATATSLHAFSLRVRGCVGGGGGGGYVGCVRMCVLVCVRMCVLVCVGGGSVRGVCGGAHVCVLVCARAHVCIRVLVC